MNFIEIIDKIFINKHLYINVSDEDKINSFFIINRKLGKGHPEMAKKFNHSGIDKASAIDMWFEFFKNEHRIPKWYWSDKKNIIKKDKKIEKDFNLIQEKYEFKEFEISFLKKYFLDDLEKEMKKLNKFENKI